MGGYVCNLEVGEASQSKTQVTEAIKEKDWGREHTIQYTNDVLQNYTSEAYISLQPISPQ